MRAAVSILLTSLVLIALPLRAQEQPVAPYKIDFDSRRDVTLHDKDEAGKDGLFVRVRFTITLEGSAAATPGTDYKIVIEEDGRRVKEEDVPRPTPTEELSVVLALDTSGSMKEHARMTQAKGAAETFLTKLPAKAECGLILFDHEIREPIVAPTHQREPLLQRIRTVEPRGGTAYFDAAARGIAMLKDSPTSRDRALVIMTDGLDLNSKASLDAVIAQARQNKVRVYTVGIGEAGKLERVNSALVLDHSGSMQPPADDQDTTPKIHAMHRAASGFVTMVPATARISLVPFSTEVGTPAEFSSDKLALISSIKKLTPQGETAIFDAAYTAIATLEADSAPGKKVVVAMTDGVDNSSRRRVDEVIVRAKEAKIPLYMLGFGRPGEIDEKVMLEMAEQTGGRYYHAKNEKALLEIFENLSIRIHDDGIDEAALTRLASETSGQYYHVKNVSDLKFILERVTESIQKKAYEVTFPSLRQVRDGTARNVSLKLVRRSGEVVSNQAGGPVTFGEQVIQEQRANYQTYGVVVAEMNHVVYLAVLGVILFLIALPAVMKRMAGTTGS